MPKAKSTQSGKLRIGDNWNAITIIALSQNNPLKAIAEFVENSIDARAKNITIIRGREHNELFLKIIDDGDGIPKDEEGVPDFKYVATHICDSIKRRLKKDGPTGIQGEFGIGLLSFWTVGEELKLISSGADGKTYVMQMAKGEPGYALHQRKLLVPAKGTELIISPLLPGIRQIHGEKIQRYLASELRDRIRKTCVHIRVIDRITRKEYKVEPRQFSGQLLHQLELKQPAAGELYLELYLNPPEPENQVGLYRSGTRVLESLAKLDRFQQAPWISGYLSGIVDVPFLNLTPGTRDGIIHDEQFAAFSEAIQPIEDQLRAIIGEQQQAEDEKTSKQMLKTVQNALKEALLHLPQEEYDWFDVHKNGQKSGRAEGEGNQAEIIEDDEKSETPSAGQARQKQFFEFPGPLFKASASPASSFVSVNCQKQYRALARDRSNKTVESNLAFLWEIIEGQGTLDAVDREIVIFTAPSEPGLVRLKLTVAQGEIICQAEGIITVTDALFEQTENKTLPQKGIPAYTFQTARGEMWRSRYDKAANVIVVNNGHRDFVFASKNKARKLRYIFRLFAKELICDNFPGLSSDQLLEHLVELSLYSEEHL